jgi:hypothetical protein
MPRQTWLDDNSDKPLIDEYTQKLTTFIDALADGQVDDSEIAAQEKRLVELMKKIEPKLDDALHGDVTKLLCELTAYNVMQSLYAMQSARPKTSLSL